MWGVETIKAVMVAIAHAVAGIAHDATGAWVEATVQNQLVVSPPKEVTIQKDEKEICQKKPKPKLKQKPRQKKGKKKRKGRRCSTSGRNGVGIAR